MAILEQPYQITVEFAGMCLFVTDGKTARVLLPNPTLVKASNHHAVLLIKDHDHLEGTPDTSITLPGSSNEYGVWSLSGRSVQFAGAFGQKELTLDISDVPPGWTPKDGDPADPLWKSVKALADINEMAKAHGLKPSMGPSETGPIVPIPFGHVSALPPAEHDRRKLRIGHEIADKETGKPRAMSDRISWKLPTVKGPTTITLSGQNSTEIVIGNTLDMPLMISNVAAGACKDKNEHHFDVYYELVKHEQRPRLKVKVGATEDPPHFPEICRPATLVV